jgi:lysozyme
MRKVSKAGIDLIKRHEGLRHNAYLCPAGVWTIGYGHTGKVKKGDSITELQAEEYLLDDIEKAEMIVDKEVPWVTQGQFDALVSFVFNVGAGNFRRSTLLRLLKDRQPKEVVANQFHRWIYGGGKALPGLVRRRQDEYTLFIS